MFQTALRLSRSDETMPLSYSSLSCLAHHERLRMTSTPPTVLDVSISDPSAATLRPQPIAPLYRQCLLQWYRLRTPSNTR